MNPTRRNRDEKNRFWRCSALVWTVSAAVAAELRVGGQSPGLQTEGFNGQGDSLASADFEGRVISIFYVDPDEKDMNVHVEDVLLKDPGLDRKNRYKGLGITNL